MCQYVLNHLTYLMIFRRLLLSFEITWFGSTWQYTEACIIQTNLFENKESTKLHAHVLCVLTCYPANVSCVLTSNVGTWARKVRENISTQGTLARKHAKHVGTRGRKTRWYTSTLLARRARHLADSKTNEVSEWWRAVFKNFSLFTLWDKTQFRISSNKRRTSNRHRTFGYPSLYIFVLKTTFVHI